MAACSYTSDPFLQANFSSWSLAFGPPPDPLPIKQSFYDRSVVDSVRSLVQSSLSSTWHRASFLAATAPHSGDWLLALPISSCGLRLDDEAVRVAVGIRLGLNLCEPHTCRCGATVDARGLHSFVCKSAPGRTARHHALNDVIYRAFSSAGIPATKEPVGLTRQDGKRPDGLTLVPWCAGKPLTWDVTAVSTLADSYVESAAREAGAPAEQAAIRKISKYSALSQNYLFQPIAVENTGVLNSSAVDFLNALGRRISSSSGEERESLFLFQRISITMQRFNAILLHNCFVRDDPDL